MLQLNYLKNEVFYIIERMWCMLFHKHHWRKHTDSSDKCEKCGQEYDFDIHP